MSKRIYFRNFKKANFIYPKNCLPLWIKNFLYKNNTSGKYELSEIQTGTEFSLNNTVERKFNIFDLKGNTYQEQLEGKNLFNTGRSIWGTNKFLYDAETDIFTLNKLSGSDWLISYGRLNLEPNTDYILYMNIIENTLENNLSLVQSSTFLTGDFVINAGQTGVKSTVLRTASEAKAYDLWLYNQGGGTFKAQIMLVKGTIVGDYERYCGGIPSPNPDYPQTIHNVSGNNNIKIQNKNLLPNNLTWQYGYVNGSGGWAGDYTHKNAFSDYIYLKAGTYTISYEIATNIISIAKYNTSKVFIERVQTIYAPNTSKNKTFTLNQDGYIRISHYDDTGSQILDNINSEKNQIEIGSTATTYVEHEEQNLPFTFAEGQKAMQGTTLQDDGIHQKRKQIVFDGSENENWTRSNSLELFYTGDIQDSAKANGDYLCNYFIKVSPTATLQNGQTKYNSTTNTLLQFKNTDITTVSAWREWLSTHNVLVEYELAEEEIIPYSETQATQYNAIKQAMSYNDQTNISQTNDDLPFILDIQYWKLKEI